MIGDAMGMPASFMSPSQIRQEWRITDVKPTKEQMAPPIFMMGRTIYRKSFIIAPITEAKAWI